jgi:5-hydroxyisourate hydrolase
MSRLTTHVLDTASGIPARGVRVCLYLVSENKRTLVKDTTTNSDGRCDAPLLEGASFKNGSYELVFFVGNYFAQKSPLPNPAFLDEIPIRFSVADSLAHYHVPLLVSPWAYSTYRGS